MKMSCFNEQFRFTECPLNDFREDEVMWMPSYAQAEEFPSPGNESVTDSRIDIAMNGYEYGLAPPERQGIGQGRQR